MNDLNEILLLKSVCQYIDVKGNIYPMDDSGNIDDMSISTIGNISNAPLDWWKELSNYDTKLADILYGGLMQ